MIPTRRDRLRPGRRRRGSTTRPAANSDDGRVAGSGDRDGAGGAPAPGAWPPILLAAALAVLSAGCPKSQPSPQRATPEHPVASEEPAGSDRSEGADPTESTAQSDESDESDESDKSDDKPDKSDESEGSEESNKSDDSDESEGSDKSARRGAPPPYRAHPLGALFRKLDRVESEGIRERATILHVGDSHTASDTITGCMRVLFQDRFGSAGRGYTYPGVPWSTFRQEQTTYEMSSEWEAHLGIVDDPDPPFAAGGLRVETTAEGAWIERGSCGLDEEDGSDGDDEESCPYGRTFDHYTIAYLVHKEGGSFNVAVDGNDPTVVETSGEKMGIGLFERGVDPGEHNIRLETEGDGPVALFGIRTRLGDKGVEYHSLGLNGATAGDFASFDPLLTRREVEALDPDLLVFAFGTNEIFNFYRMHESDEYSLQEVTRAMADYQDDFRQLLDRYRAAAPDASCLVMLPPDLAPRRENVECRRTETVGDREVCIPPTIRGWGTVIATQRAAARQAGCAIWNQSKAMGGEGSIRLWAAMSPALARSDGIHLTMEGYDLLAEAFFSDLMRTFEVWKKGGQLPLETRPISEGAEIDALESDVF